MKKYSLTLLLLGMFVAAQAQPSATYYTSSTLDGKNGRDLELALAAIVYPHNKVGYDNLWKRYEITDVLPESLLADPSLTDQVYDMYASWTDFPKYYSAHNGETTAQLHSQTGGFNREHSVPNSWWGGKDGNGFAYTDLHHLVPADGAANNAKGDNPLGEYAEGFIMSWPTQTKTSTMGNNTNYTYVCADNTADHSGSWSHVWTITADDNGYGGGSNKVWEPADEFKGDFARMYLYVVCAYEGQLTWKTRYMFENEDSYTVIKPWAKELLLKWHRQDPVSDKERNRNNAVFTIQNNRNPFIDYPELAEYIWGNKSSESFVLANAVSAYANWTPTITKADPQLSFTSPVYIVYEGDAFTSPELSTLSDGAVIYESSATTVANVEENTGTVTINGIGETTITATQFATDEYTAATASYLLKVVPRSVSVKTNGLGWATFAPSYNVNMPEDEGVEIYYIAETNADKTVVYTADARAKVGNGVMATATGVLIKTDGQATVTFPVSTENEAAGLEGNLLVGVTEDTDMTDKANAYIFTKKNDELGFYICTGGTLAANKCYLQLTDEQAAKAPLFIVLPGDTQDDIEEVVVADGECPMYDLSGRRVSKAYKGVVIIKGQKAIKK